MDASLAGASSRERRFYSRMAIAMLVVVFLGFAPSFYLRGLIEVPRPSPTMTPLIWVHGIVFTAWILLFFVQSRLITAGRRDVHMQLGILGFTLGVVMLVIGFYTGIGQIERANNPPFVTPLSWSALPLFSLPLMAVTLGMGWQHRRNAQTHKRLMLFYALLLMEPAIGRIPIFGPPGFLSQYLGAGVAWAMIIPLIIWDMRTMGRLHWATLFGALSHAALLIVRSVLWTTGEWQRIAQAISGA